MKHVVCLWTVVLVCGMMLVSCQDKPSLADLEQQLSAAISNEPGVFALAWKDLTTGDSLLIGAHASFHAASTMKTPVMIEVYKQAAAGRFSLQDSVPVKNEFYSIVDSSLYSLSPDQDSETGLYTRVGEKRSLDSLVYDMIIVSSNLATNLVIDLVDAREVTQTMRELGARDINVLRGVEDQKAYDQGLSNTTTAYDLMVIFEKLARREVVNPEASAAMIDILLDQRFNDVIPAYLPAEVKVAHKTGTITGVHHDSGIVMLPDGRAYVLVLLSKELPDFDAGTEFLARLSEKVYQFMTGH